MEALREWNHIGTRRGPLRDTHVCRSRPTNQVNFDGIQCCEATRTRFCGGTMRGEISVQRSLVRLSRSSHGLRLTRFPGSRESLDFNEPKRRTLACDAAELRSIKRSVVIIARINSGLPAAQAGCPRFPISLAGTQKFPSRVAGSIVVCVRF